MKTIYRVTVPSHIYEPQYVKGPIYKDVQTIEEARKLVKRVQKILDISGDSIKDSTDKYRDQIYNIFNCRHDACFVGPAYIQKITIDKVLID